MKLPGVAQEIAEVIGRERALYLIGALPRCFVGREGAKSHQVMLYVPKTVKPGHALVRILGLVDAKRMVDAFGGEYLKPPTCACVYRRFRDQAALQMIADGMIPHQVANVLGVTESIVRKVVRENPPVSELVASNDNAGSLNRTQHA